MTEFVVLGRGEGKTSYLIDWVLEAPYHHLFVPTMRERNIIISRLCEIRPGTEPPQWMDQVRELSTPDQMRHMMGQLIHRDRNAVFGIDDIERAMAQWLGGIHFAVIAGTHTDRPGCPEPPDGDNDPPHDGSFALSA